MKKLLLVLAVAGFAVACNSSSEKKETSDTTVVTPVDTTNKMMDTTMHPVDTTHKDTTKM